MRRSGPIAVISRRSSNGASALGIDRPGAVDRMVLRRYLAYLGTRQYERRSIARKAASLRRYFAYATKRSLVPSDPARRLSVSAGTARLPRVLNAEELGALLEPEPAPARPRVAGRPRKYELRACETTPCSSCSTARGCG